jgi:lactate dehydrogenase-like 2-hydroxyacid dehydrogenase
MNRVFVSAFIPADILRPLAGSADVDMWEDSGPVPRTSLLERLYPCQGWVSMLTDTVDDEALDAAPALLVISQMSVGVDNIDVEACRHRGIAIGHTPDVLTETVADTAFALMAAALRRLPEGERMVKAGAWGPWDPWQFLGSDIHGATLGIVGMGRIGQAVARRVSGFEMTVIYTSRTSRDVPGATRVDLSDLLHTADVVLIAAPLSQQTRGMIGKAELAMMRPDAYLVNVARGALVDTDALVDALARGGIGGAALDVTDPEPLPPDHPLLDFPNCLVVPHVGSASVTARRAMARLAVDNMVAALAGEPMPAPLLEGIKSAEPPGDSLTRP